MTIITWNSQTINVVSTITPPDSTSTDEASTGTFLCVLLGPKRSIHDLIDIWKTLRQ